jgi:hypothetical protein
VGLFKRRRASVAYPQQEAAEERFEREEEGEVGARKPGLSFFKWSTRSRQATEEERLELRAVADPESDVAEERFIRSEREAEERGRWGEPLR